jgi:hypothetical protein
MAGRHDSSGRDFPQVQSPVAQKQTNKKIKIMFFICLKVSSGFPISKLGMASKINHLVP